MSIMHFSRFIYVAVVALLCGIAAGCGSPSATRRLALAEETIDTNPDSALAILRSIPASRLRGEQRALHALLLSKAYDKNYIDIADDSLINIAFNYYSFKPGSDSRYRMLTFYYKGVVAYYGEDYSSAIHYLTIADSLASRITDWTYRGLSNSLIAASFNKVYDLIRDHEHAKLALDFFRLEGDSTHIRNQLYSVGITYDQLSKYDSAMVYFGQAGYDFSSWGVASSLLGLGRIDDFKRHLAAHPHLASDPLIQSRYARALIANKNYAEAAEALNRAYADISCGNDSIQWLIPHAYLQCSNANWKEYAADLETLLKDEIDQNKHLKQIYTPAAQSAAKEFLVLSDLRALELQRFKLYLGMMAGVLLAIAAALIGIIINRSQRNKFSRQKLRLAKLNVGMRRNNDGLKRRIDQIIVEKNLWHDRAKELQDIISNTEHTAGLTESEEHQYLLERKQNLNILYEQLLSIPSTESAIDLLQLKVAIDSYNQPEFTDRIDTLINRVYNNYIIQAKAAHLSTKDITLLRLLICGFDIPHISVIMDISAAAISTRKSRLKAKIEKAGLPPIPRI